MIFLTVYLYCPIHCLGQTNETALLNSKELLERTGISRATLNNYISWGIVPKPEVLPPEPGEGAAPRIGYFPDDVVARIEEIHRLKREGWSMTRIAEHLGAPSPAGGTPGPAVPPAPPPLAPLQPAAATSRPALPRLTIADIAHPAYLVDHGFEVIWVNERARSGPLAGLARAGADAPRNVFRFLLEDGSEQAAHALRFHLGLAKQQAVGLPELCRTLEREQADRLERLYREAPQPRREVVSQVSLPASGTPPVRLYAVQFREGILFAHVPEGGPSDQLASVLAQRESASGEPGRKRPPVLSQVAVLVTDLQHSGRLWSDLPAEEYFDLINQVWLTVDPIFRRHHGTHGKHPGDGLVGYFFPQPDGSHLWNALQAAQEAKAAMRAISTEWQARKGWRTELYLNTGLDEGQQWLGTLQPAGQVELTMHSAALNRALRIAGFARSGAIWATKNLVARLTPSQRDRLRFGVRQAGEDFVASVFSTVDHLTDPARPLSEQLREIARLPITEIVELSATVTDAPGVAGRGPV